MCITQKLENSSKTTLVLCRPMHDKIINAYLLISGILPSVHPTKDQLQTMHQEPAVQHPENQPEPMSVLQAQEVHGCGNEQRW